MQRVNGGQPYEITVRSVYISQAKQHLDAARSGLATMVRVDHVRCAICHVASFLCICDASQQVVAGCDALYVEVK